MKYELSVNLYYSIIGPNAELHEKKLRESKIQLRTAQRQTMYLNVKLLNNNFVNFISQLCTFAGVAEIGLINIFMFKHILYSTIQV